MTREPACCNRKSCRHTQRSKVPTNVQVVVEVKDTFQQNACKTVREDEPDNSRDKTEDGELDRKDAGNARASSAERLQHDDLTNAPIPCACNRARKNKDARE